MAVDVNYDRHPDAGFGDAYTEDFNDDNRARGESHGDQCRSQEKHSGTTCHVQEYMRRVQERTGSMKRTSTLMIN